MEDGEKLQMQWHIQRDKDCWQSGYSKGTEVYPGFSGSSSLSQIRDFPHVKIRLLLTLMSGMEKMKVKEIIPGSRRCACLFSCPRLITPGGTMERQAWGGNGSRHLAAEISYLTLLGIVD